MESYDGAWLLFDAIKRAGGTDPKAIIHALETTSYVGARGKYSFSTSKDPAWHYHQFLEAPLSLLQYSEVKQGQADAPIVWPKQFATVPYMYKKPALMHLASTVPSRGRGCRPLPQRARWTGD